MNVLSTVASAGGFSRAYLEDVIGRTPFAGMLGARLLEFGEGRAGLELDLRSDLTMHLGYAHGAVIGVLADSACAWAAASLAGQVVTAEYQLILKAPGVGVTLSAHGQVVKAAGRVFTARAEVLAASGGDSALVATALATVVKLR
jgi:uncharacterized protein (TIGR00369 family)